MKILIRIPKTDCKYFNLSFELYYFLNFLIFS